MKKVTKVIAVLAVLIGIGGSVFAQPFVGEKESSEMKKRRNSQVKMRILHVQGAVEMGRITKAEGAYRVKAIKYYNAFKNANPEWTIFKMGRYHHGRKYGRPPEGCRGGRGDRMNGSRRGDRGNNKLTRKNETSAMKKIRHKIENIRIKRIKDAAKKGYLGGKQAAYIVKRIKHHSRFKNANPEWAKYGRGRRNHQSKGRRGSKGGMRGCNDSRRGGRGQW